MAIKNKIEVKIAGVAYTLVGAESEEYMVGIAQYIDKKMSDMQRVNNKLSASMASVLTAVNVADDFFKSRENEINAKNSLKHAQREIERLKEELKRVSSENRYQEERNSRLQHEIVKRDTELNDLKGYNEANSRQKMYIAK